jgi:hypothetical protein
MIAPTKENTNIRICPQRKKMGKNNIKMQQISQINKSHATVQCARLMDVLHNGMRNKQVTTKSRNLANSKPH